VIGSLAEKLTAPTIGVVADECLEYIPWSALPKPGTKAPLIAAHEVVQLPSASALVLLQQVSANRPAPTKALAVLADPVYDRADSRAGKAKGTPPAQPAASGQFRSVSFYRAVQTLREVGLSGPQLAVPRLQTAKNEAKVILNIAPEGSRIGWSDLQASRDTLLGADLSSFRVLHFATQGMVSTEQPTTSGVVLSMVNPAGQSQNGFVLGPDFFNLKLNADLVVFGNMRANMSAQPQSGGVFGLHRALAYAGAPRLMVGMWPVGERVATTFWTAFYRNLLVEKQRPAAALRAAQLQVMKEKKWASPYYWAAFGMYGDFR
jgi:CHAT domain-containing protein